MKKKYLFLLAIPVLCLFSCNKKAVTYRDNYTERFIETKRDIGTRQERWITQSLTVEYDENGLPTKKIKTKLDKKTGQTNTSTYEYRRTFDDKHREIRYEETFTPSIDDSELLITTTTREYNGDFLLKETYDEKEYFDSVLFETTAIRYRHKIENKNGYSMLSVRFAHRTGTEEKNIKLEDEKSFQFSIKSYDKQKRNIASLVFTMSRTKTSINDNIGEIKHIDFDFTSISYKSTNNNSNDFYNYSFSQDKLLSSNRYGASEYDETFVTGSETYSDKNLLIKRQETEELRDTFLNPMSTTFTLECEYDDLDRLIHEKNVFSTYDEDGKPMNIDTSTIDHTYINNDKIPSKTVTHTINENKEKMSKVESNMVRTIIVDEYGRVLSIDTERERKKGESIIKSSEHTDNKYGNPIVAPEGEILIEEELEETILF